jgi:RimJ/RimL family protein N-acetyltransferase
MPETTGGQTPRLNYRALCAGDANALHAIVTHWDVTRQLGPSWPWPADPVFTKTRTQPYEGPGFVWGVFFETVLIGIVGVTKGELGYMLAPTVWGRGFATQACTAALRHAFEHDGLTQVHAGVWADNAASLAVLAKLGFTLKGENSGTSAARPAPSPGFDLHLSRSNWRGA